MEKMKKSIKIYSEKDLTRMRQARTNSDLFSYLATNRIKSEGIFGPIYNGWDEPFFVVKARQGYCACTKDYLSDEMKAN